TVKRESQRASSALSLCQTKARSRESNSPTPLLVSFTSAPNTLIRPCSDTIGVEQQPTISLQPPSSPPARRGLLVRRPAHACHRSLRCRRRCRRRTEQ